MPRQGRRLSEIGKDEPYQAMRLAALYRCCVDSKEPVAMRSTMGHDATVAKFTHVEAVVLPLGPNAHTVDHLLGFGLYEQRVNGC